MSPDRRIPLPRILRVGLLITGLIWSDGLGQMEPDAPVRDFQLPRFGDDGYKIWDLRGRRGIYVNPDRIDVEGMRLRLFHPGDPESLQLQIESPRATIYPRENRAEGDGILLVLGPNFSLSGTDWEWEGETDIIRVGANARVAFNEEITDILK